MSHPPPQPTPNNPRTRSTTSKERSEEESQIVKENDEAEISHELRNRRIGTVVDPLTQDEARAAIRTETFEPNSYDAAYELAPGYVGIQWQCDRLYGNDIAPYPQFTSTHKRRMGGGRLDYCNSYTGKDGTSFHYISMGASQLYRVREYHDEDDMANYILGDHFEFTVRFPKLPQQIHAPMWPFNMMQKLANDVCGDLLPGWWFGLDSPFLENNTGTTTLISYVCIPDVELPPFISPFGVEVHFLQLVGLTQREHNELDKFYHRKYAIRFVKELIAPIQQNSTLITHMNRKCSWEVDETRANTILAQLKADKAADEIVWAKDREERAAAEHADDYGADALGDDGGDDGETM